MRRILAAAVLLGSVHLPPARGAQAPASSCPIASEAAFATSRTQAVQVGGGAIYAAARERRYLDALRGPVGELLQYKRTGSLPPEPDGRTIIDTYEVTYPGLEKPVVLYLDAYHFDDSLRAPRGFVCAVPIGLAAPPPDSFLASESVLVLAIEQGAAKEFPPISLDADGSHAHGVLFDQFRLIARASRAATLSGRPIDPKRPPVEILRARMVIVAYPLRCGDTAPVSPGAIDIVAADGQAPRRDGDTATGDALARLLPGASLPAGSMGASFFVDRPRPSDAIRIAYPDGGCGSSAEVALPMQVTAAKPLNTPQPALPAGQASTDRPVRLQALIDLDGIARRIVYIGGPAVLADAAIDAVREWTAEPARLNGAPVITPVTLQVKFGPR
jgi:hypothetical protein